MAFMGVQISEQGWYRVETSAGTFVIPDDLVSAKPSLSDFKDYVEGTPESFSKAKEKIGARLSASGYLDCTDWELFSSERAVIKHYVEEEGLDCRGDDIDFENIPKRTSMRKIFYCEYTPKV